MAKGNMFLSQARGKVGSVVFSVIRGQQVERVHNPSPANPRSYAQQAQRSLLANMTKFYKRGTQNFYKFAFQDKTARESDFNAFARNNMQQGVFFTKEMYENPAAPALGEFLLTKGEINHNVGIVVGGDHVSILPRFTSNISTIGQLSSQIISSNPGVEEGDIFTLVIAESDLLPGNTLLGTTPPSWDTIQFYLNPSDQNPLSSVGLSCEEEVTSGNGYYVYADINAVDRASFAALTISRPTSDGLKVSNTRMAVSPAAAILIDWNRGEYAKRQAAISWGGNPEAFLAGGQLDTLPTLSDVTVGPTHSSPFSYGMGTIIVDAQGFQIGATLAGTGLRTTAQGAAYEAVVYDATAIDLEIMLDYYQPRYSFPLEGTGTSTNIALTGRLELNPWYQPESGFQGYLLIKIDGVPVWWGMVTRATP